MPCVGSRPPHNPIRIPVVTALQITVQPTTAQAASQQHNSEVMGPYPLSGRGDRGEPEPEPATYHHTIAHEFSVLLKLERSRTSKQRTAAIQTSNPHETSCKRY